MTMEETWYASVVVKKVTNGLYVVSTKQISVIKIVKNTVIQLQIEKLNLHKRMVKIKQFNT